MIRPLFVVLLCSIAFLSGYVLGMFHTVIHFYWQSDDKTLPHSKEVVLTSLLKAGDK